MTITNSFASKIAAAVLTVAMIVGVLFVSLGTAQTAHAALTESQIQSILSLLDSFGADSATVSNVETSLRGGTPSGGSGSGSGSSDFSYTFTQSFDLGDTGAEVMKLQEFLNSSLVPGIQVASSGAGSPGNETSYFGPATKAAVVAFQNKYSAQVLAPVGLSVGTGYWGPSSRAHANSLVSAGGGSTGGDTGGDTGGSVDVGFTGLKVMSVSQPSGSLAPDNASRVPFTKFRVQAGNNDVTVNSVTVKRIGLGSNSAFSSVILLDQDGVVLGNEKTLNSNNEARIGETYTVPAGETRTFTVAGNMPSDNSARDGEQLTLQVTAINTSASVQGSLPITGATHTVNASLAVGTATMSRGANDPNSSSTQEVGTTAYKFASVKITAGSAEDIWLRSIRWDQTGSASASDLDNIKVVVDGTKYDTVLGADGDKYTAIFPGSGILIEEGLSEEVYIEGDIVDGASRTIVFDIEDATDVHVVGDTFGYGITPTAESTGAEATTGSAFSTDGDPFFDASHITVGAGSLTVSSSNVVPAGNIANGADDVSLGAYKFDVDGESLTWSQITLTIASTSGGGTNGNKTITNVSLVDENGAVLAGPTDPNAAGSSVVLSDSVTIDPGEHVLVVKGNLDNDWVNGDTIQIQLTTSNISSLKGETSGTTVTPSPSATVNAKTQTISAGSLTVSPSTSLSSQNIVGNSTDVLLGRYVLDATDSGEDVRVQTVKIRGVTGVTADLDELNSLRLFNGSTVLNTGSNQVDPSSNNRGADATLTFTLDDQGLTIPKGTTVTLELKGNVATGTGNSKTTYNFNFTSLTDGDWGTTGKDTGQDITEDLDTSSNGSQMTISSAGTVTVSLDAADPVEKWYLAGETATIGIFDFLSTVEEMDLTELELELDTASSSASDFAEISLWDGDTVLFTKSVPAWNNNEEFFDFASAGADFTIPADDDNDLIVKAKFAQIGTNKPGRSGSLLKLATTTDQSNNKSRGAQSGTTVTNDGSVSTSTGARYFRALPEVAAVSYSVPTLANGTKELYRFSVTAKGDDVALYKFTFNIATTNVTTTNFKVTELETGKIVRSSMNTVDSNGDLGVTVNNSTYGSTVITIPSGQKRTYKLEGTVANAGTSNETESLSVKLLGDEAFTNDLAAGQVAAGTTQLDAQAEDDFIWSPQSTTTASTSAGDWFNGFRVPGIEFDDLDTVSLSN